MANEISVRGGVTYQSLNYQRQSAFNLNQETSTPLGPTPGAFLVPTYGVACDLDQLVTPGICMLRNLDTVNYVEFGVRDPGTGVFYPLGELGPREEYPIKLSRNLLEEYTNTGTGTTSPGNQFWFKANTAACVVSVEAFER